MNLFSPLVSPCHFFQAFATLAALEAYLIFERFEKLNDFAQGSGLGLSICQLIVTYMRGRIWVDSNYTQGARFCFTHPLKYKSKGEDAV